MTDKRFLDAYQSVQPDEEMSGRIWARLMAQAETASPEKEVILPARKRTGKLWRTALIAAVIAGLMGVTAYAAGIFGREALEIQEPEITPHKLVIGEDGMGHSIDNPDEGGIFSITQPQELPEDIDPAIREKVENNKAAWAEWEAWFKENRVKMPAVFNGPEDARKSELTENEDGSWTLVFSRPEKSDEELIAWANDMENMHETDPEKAAEMERHTGPIRKIPPTGWYWRSAALRLRKKKHMTHFCP